MPRKTRSPKKSARSTTATSVLAARLATAAKKPNTSVIERLLVSFVFPGYGDFLVSEGM